MPFPAPKNFSDKQKGDYFVSSHKKQILSFSEIGNGDISRFVQDLFQKKNVFLFFEKLNRTLYGLNFFSEDIVLFSVKKQISVPLNPFLFPPR